MRCKLKAFKKNTALIAQFILQINVAGPEIHTFLRRFPLKMCVSRNEKIDEINNEEKNAHT